MLPVIVLVGATNVGKSTLFNRLTRSRDALVADFPGLTRDRHYGRIRLRVNTDSSTEETRAEASAILVDTGGFALGDSGIDALMTEQTREAITEANIVLLIVDGRAGLSALDEQIASELRRSGKPVMVMVNKSEGRDNDQVSAEFMSLGFASVLAISAEHNQGIAALEQKLSELLADELVIDNEPATLQQETPSCIRVALVGRPNVGKSTLTNRILGEERVIVFDQPGTTLDSVSIPFTRREQDYILIDTAGIRRKARVEDAVEKFSVIKTLRAIGEAHVVIMVIDAHEGITEQDLHILGEIVDQGRGLIIAYNKWDGLSEDSRRKLESDCDRRLRFVDFAFQHRISALHGTGVGDLFPSIRKAHRSAWAKLGTTELTELLHKAQQYYPPPYKGSRRVKLRYAHQGGRNPPLIVIHGNQVARLPAAYQRYLTRAIRDHFHLEGTPIRLELRTGENPFTTGST